MHNEREVQDTHSQTVGTVDDGRRSRERGFSNILHLVSSTTDTKVKLRLTIRFHRSVLNCRSAHLAGSVLAVCSLGLVADWPIANLPQQPLPSFLLAEGRTPAKTTTLGLYPSSLAFTIRLHICSPCVCLLNISSLGLSYLPAIAYDGILCSLSSPKDEEHPAFGEPAPDEPGRGSSPTREKLSSLLLSLE